MLTIRIKIDYKTNIRFIPSPDWISSSVSLISVISKPFPSSPCSCSFSRSTGMHDKKLSSIVEMVVTLKLYCLIFNQMSLLLNC